MTESKIKWEGWCHFKNWDEFSKFVKENIDTPYNRITWITKDCPIVIWIN